MRLKEEGGHGLWDAVYPRAKTCPKGSKTCVKCLNWRGRRRERMNEYKLSRQKEKGESVLAILKVPVGKKLEKD